MGITVPMRILITDSRIADDPVVKDALEKLTKQGHEVRVDDGYQQYDFICGGNCWYLKPELANLFMLAITNARRVCHADTERVEAQRLAKTITRKPAKPRMGTSTKHLPSNPVEDNEGGC